MRSILARAPVRPVRQRTQFSCVACSTMMCLQAWGVECDETIVNKVLGAVPMKGASWEQVLACVQHYGMRGTLVCPSTIGQLKQWTDRNIPVIIAWNPEGRDWSHASVVFDVDDQHTVYVADPNIPDPEETVRVVPKAEFYKKWFEKWPHYLVRRPACAIEPETTPDGMPRFARKGGIAKMVKTEGGKIFLTATLLSKLLGLVPRRTKIEDGWIIYTGLTQLDEVFFINVGRMSNRDDVGDELMYRVAQRGDAFERSLEPILKDLV